MGNGVKRREGAEWKRFHVRWECEKNKAPRPCGPGAKSGGGRSSRALSRRHTLGRARFRGRCASRRHSPRQAELSVSWRDRPDRYRSGFYRVRPLRPVRSLPAGSGTPDVVRTRLQYQVLASAPLPRGRHQLLAGRWPRVTGLTSYLSGCFRSCSGVTWFFTPSHRGGVTNIARFARSPPSRLPFAPAAQAWWAFGRGGPAG